MKSYSDWVKESNPGNYVAVGVQGLPLSLVASLPGTITPSPHITLMYSENSAVPLSHIDYVLRRKHLTGTSVMVVGAEVYGVKADSTGEETGAIVLTVQSPILNDIHNKLLAMGCKHSYPEFSAHATLIYDVPLAQANLVIPEIRKEIATNGIHLVLTSTVNESIKQDWETSTK